jgi:hypothetical protein
MTHAVEQDEALYPENILIFRANAVMLHPDARADLIEQLRRGRRSAADRGFPAALAKHGT